MNIDKVETESITKVARTDKDVDNASLELKQKYSYTDDYGNKGFFYRKEVVSATQYEADLQTKKAELTKQLADIATVEEKIESLPKVK